MTQRPPVAVAVAGGVTHGLCLPLCSGGQGSRRSGRLDGSLSALRLQQHSCALALRRGLGLVCPNRRELCRM